MTPQQAATIITAVVSAVCAIVGMLIGWMTFNASSKRKSEDRGRCDGEMISDLKYIKETVGSIQSQIEKINDNYVKLMIKVSEVDKKADRANTRIDVLEVKNNGK